MRLPDSKNESRIIKRMNCLKVAKFLKTGTVRSDSYSKFGPDFVNAERYYKIEDPDNHVSDSSGLYAGTSEYPTVPV